MGEDDKADSTRAVPMQPCREELRRGWATWKHGGVLERPYLSPPSPSPPATGVPGAGLGAGIRPGPGSGRSVPAAPTSCL